MSTLSSANVTDINLVLKEHTHMHLCLDMLILTHNLDNWLIVSIVTGISDKELMFYEALVYLFVCLSVASFT